jgi:hypothetical protein
MLTVASFDLSLLMQVFIAWSNFVGDYFNAMKLKMIWVIGSFVDKIWDYVEICNVF